jgi:hypothetical protein
MLIAPVHLAIDAPSSSAPHLWRGLRGAWASHPGAGHAPANAVRGGLALGYADFGTAGTPEWVPTQFGPANHRPAGSSNWYYTATAPNATSPASTFAVLLRLTQTNIFQVIASHEPASSTNAGYRIELSSSARWSFVLGSVSGYEFADLGFASADVWYMYMVSVTGNGGTATAYLHRYDTRATLTQSRAIGTMNATALGRFTLRGTGRTSVYLTGSMPVAYWWDRPLSAGEVGAVIADPFAPVRPRRRIWAPTISAAPSFNPAWAAYSNVTIQPGIMA